MMVVCRGNYEVFMKYFFQLQNGEYGNLWENTGLLKWENSLLHIVRSVLLQYVIFIMLAPTSLTQLIKGKSPQIYFSY